MRVLNLQDVKNYVENNIAYFHQKRIENINKLKLSSILRRKNPYLFKAKYTLTSEQIIKSIVDAYASSSEETIFGDWLEGLAVFICGKVYDGVKSGIEGIDIEFNNDDVRYIVSVKSGPNWGNSQAVQKMIGTFLTAARILRTSNSRLNVIAVNGCCYGKENKPDKGVYFKYCGQRFWEFISGDQDVYIKIIEPLGTKAREKNDDYMQSYTNCINKFTREFTQDYCRDTGEIDWVKLVEFNSSK